jgi:hypothetical protein
MNALTTTRAGAASLAPQNFQEAVHFAKMLAQSAMVPKDYVGKPENVMVALQWGAEVGLGPLQALNGISIINGRPALWGDAALALVRGHAACEWIKEGVEGEGDARHGFCEVKRKGSPQAERRTFSMADAKRAGLAGKSGPWQQYPDRMLQLRARGFAIRDVFPDALRGVITAEEAQDIEAAPMPPARGPTIDAAASMATRAAPPWEAMAWPICKRDGTCEDMGDPDIWAEVIQRRVKAVQDSTKAPEAKTRLIRQIADANKDAWDHLAGRGYESAVAEIEALFTAALGEGADA